MRPNIVQLGFKKDWWQVPRSATASYVSSSGTLLLKPFLYISLHFLIFAPGKHTQRLLLSLNGSVRRSKFRQAGGEHEVVALYTLFFILTIAGLFTEA